MTQQRPQPPAASPYQGPAAVDALRSITGARGQKWIEIFHQQLEYRRRLESGFASQAEVMIAQRGYERRPCPKWDGQEVAHYKPGYSHRYTGLHSHLGTSIV